MNRSTREVKAKVKAIYDNILELKYVKHSENLSAELEKAIAETKSLWSPDLTLAARKYWSGHLYGLLQMKGVTA